MMQQQHACMHCTMAHRMRREWSRPPAERFPEGVVVWAVHVHMNIASHCITNSMPRLLTGSSISATPGNGFLEALYNCHSCVSQYAQSTESSKIAVHSSLLHKEYTEYRKEGLDV